MTLVGEGFSRNFRVLVQGEGLVENVPEIKEKQLYEMATHFGTERLIFQAKDTRAHHWFIANFGHEISMDVESSQVMAVELMRRGVRRRGVFGLVAAYKE
ncbi:MAG: phosphosulfolactate synthase [Bacillota bacterium]